MGRTRKGPHVSLGKSLTKKNKAGWDRTTLAGDRHTTAEEQTNALKSVTEETSYDEFIATATLANKDFTAEKLNIKFVSLSTVDPTVENEEYISEAEKKMVVVPRRPKWTTEMTAEELDLAEREAFLNWRRSMAQLQDKEGVTPFERNLEVWRQLWRVVERSDVIVQIVDARNPLLYRCDDLEAYVREMGKENILLINKADFLTEEQRKFWSEYFKSVNLPHAFYSAAEVVSKLQEVITEDTDESSSSDDEKEKQEPEQNKRSEACVNLPPNIEKQKNLIDILGREELIIFMKNFKKDDAEMLAVGLVGYPNVGKSSTINSLMSSKKTSVSATPGKTKHFQTLFLEKELLLCDCPGLVMPAFGGSKGEMVLGGILPIDNLTNYTPAMHLLAKRIPQSVLQRRYGVTLPPDFNEDDLLNAYASIRGFMTVRGIPDCSRASRIILKDYVNGKTLYCHSPPNVKQNTFQSHHALEEYRIQSKSSNIEAGCLTSDEKTVDKPTTVKKPNLEKVLDNQFFRPNVSTVHYKGKHIVASGLSTSNISSDLEKPWKKHNNHNKREKLRRVYRHLDVE